MTVNKIKRFECPVCNRLYKKKENAEDCLALKPEQAKFKIGDVVKYFQYINEGSISGETKYAEVLEIHWSDADHQLGASYQLAGGFTLETEACLTLYMTKADRAVHKEVVDKQDIKDLVFSTVWEDREGIYKKVVKNERS